MKKGRIVTIQMGLPSFSGGPGRPSLATIHLGHYGRLQAVLAAARTGDALLLRLAVEHQDKHGSGE